MNIYTSLSFKDFWLLFINIGKYIIIERLLSYQILGNLKRTCLLHFIMKYLIKGGQWKNVEDEMLKAAVMKYGLN